MRRVTKSEMQVSKAIQDDPLQLCLDCWKVMMNGDADRDLKAKTMGGLIGNSDGYGVDIYEAQHASDMRIAQATDAMIDSMRLLYKWAIYRSCSIASPWRFPNADLVTVAETARLELIEKLKKNVCTSVLF